MKETVEKTRAISTEISNIIIRSMTNKSIHDKQEKCCRIHYIETIFYSRIGSKFHEYHEKKL